MNAKVQMDPNAGKLLFLTFAPSSITLTYLPSFPVARPPSSGLATSDKPPSRSLTKAWLQLMGGWVPSCFPNGV